MDAVVNEEEQVGNEEKWIRMGWYSVGIWNTS